MSGKLKTKIAAWWRRVSKVKLGIWAAIIIAAALGFAHQYMVHSDGYIKNYIEKNKAAYSAAAELLLEKPTSAGDFTETLSSQVKKLNKFSLELLMDSPVYKDDKAVLEAVEKCGVQDVKSTEKVVRFYQSYRFEIIYAPGADSVDGAEPAGDGWFYVKTY